uniref:Major facilitator superfamily (MFS) profile domain-containing protein n=1 Tax=Dicentrarchus labrax TaxID=13489 RepID=A0A8C4GHQ3_DICLA
MADPYQNNVYHQGGGDSYRTYGKGGDQDGYGYQADYPPQEEDAASDVTEGHDEEDQMYEGEYQGIPHPDEVKAAQRAARAEHGQSQTLAKTRAAGSAVSELEELSEQYEDIMEDCGHGKFQWTLFVVLGLALMADGVECFVVAFVLPSAEKDLCLSNAEKGMLGLMVFLSMMVGAFLWGGLADKVGRRRCLVVALAINCIFAFLSSFAQGYGFFLFFRLLSGIGIGGTVPIVYSYFSEFLQMDKRGEHLSWLCMFWMIGGIYASFTAWGIIPRYGWGFSMGTEFQFHSWRVFVLVAALPAIASLVGLTFMPESPRFLLENAKHDEAWMILKQVHDTNWRAKGQPEKVFTVSTRCYPKCSSLSVWVEVTFWLFYALFADSIFSLSTFCHSYYGLSVWFPDMIKHLQYEEYVSKVKVFHKERVVNFHFNFSLENQIHKEGEYIQDEFISIEMKSVKFEDSLFENCRFEDIKSTDTVFENCTIRSTVFRNTDLGEEKFINCKMENTSFEHNKTGCHLDTVEENDDLIYLVSFLGSLAVLPGNIISALFMEKIGRVKIIGGSMLISAGCTFFLFLSFSQSAIIALQCLFCGVSVAAWNGIEVVTVELYPASKRATAFGVLNALCKLAAVLGSSIFASFVGVSKAVPILLSFAALVCGGLVALKLPDTREKILQ